MPQSYKVFIDDNCLLIGPGGEKNTSFEAGERLLCDSVNLEELLASLENNGRNKRILLQTDDVRNCWKKFRSRYVEIPAAGGVVWNGREELLMIRRLGKWDLPKGKREVGEDMKVCALREVEEECGVSGLSIEKPLDTTYHTYILHGKRILKKTQWYSMRCSGGDSLTPQIEEDVTEVRWVGKSEIHRYLKNTYPSIRELLSPYLT